MSDSGTGADKLRAVRMAVYSRLLNLTEKLHSLTAQEITRLDRTIWRVGELSIEEAVPLLVDMAKADPGPTLRNYSIIWALGRMGRTEGLDIIESVSRMAGADDLAVRRICHEVRYHLTASGEKFQLLEQYRQSLPAPILEALSPPDVELLSQRLGEYLWPLAGNPGQQARRGGFAAFVNRTEGKNAPGNDNAATKETGPVETDLVVETLYLLSLEDQGIRQFLYSFVDTVKLIGRANISAFRTLWKMAEFRFDACMFARIVKRFEKTKNGIPSYSWDRDIGYLRGMRSSVPYFRRRSWRTLRKPGELGDMRYIDLAEAILLSMSDEDGVPENTKEFVEWKWDRDTRSYSTRKWTVTYGEYTSYLAFGYILYGNSQRLKPAANNNWIVENSSAVDKRAESFPELWDQVPERLFGLLGRSECRVVHEFSVSALKSNRSFLDAVGIDDWFTLLDSRYEVTASLSLEALGRIYGDREPDGRLIRACLLSPHVSIREAGQDWLRRVPRILLQDLALLAWMISSEDGSIRGLSREMIGIVDAQEEKRQLLLELVIGNILELKAEAPVEITDNLNWVMLEIFRDKLPLITFETIDLFISHASPGINLLGARILVARNLRPHEIPPHLYGRLFNSVNAEVRAQAIALMQNLKDEELAQWHEMLGNLMLSDQPQVRAEARKLIARAVAFDSQFPGKVLQKLLSAVFRAETSEGLHEDLVAVFDRELRSGWQLIDKNQLWRLLVAQSKGAQRLGALILGARSTGDYTVRQWATLGGNPSLGVRAWVWKAYEDNVGLIRENIEDGLQIFSSNWEDSRSFAFDYFSKNFPFEQWSVEQVIALCDNKHQEVQDLGQNIVFSQAEQNGAQYLKALSEHPSMKIQRFIGQFLEKHAAGQTGKIVELEQYFISVLCRVNRGRAAKDQVLNFLHMEAVKDRKVAEMVARIMDALSLSAAMHDKAVALEIMRDLIGRFPGLNMPVKTRKPEIRGYSVDTIGRVRG